MKKQPLIRPAADQLPGDRVSAGPPGPLQRDGGAATRSPITDRARRPASLGACFDCVAGQPDGSAISADFLRETKAALARATGQDLADLPADPDALQPILAAVRPNNIFWYRNALRLVRDVLIQSGWWPRDPPGKTCHSSPGSNSWLRSSRTGRPGAGLPSRIPGVPRRRPR